MKPSATMHFKALPCENGTLNICKNMCPFFFSGRKESVEASARERNPELLHELQTECQACNYLKYY